MCIGSPVQVVSPGEWSVICRYRHDSLILADTRLLDPPQEGAWLFVSCRAALRRLEEDEAHAMINALNVQEQTLAGEGDPLAGFVDLFSGRLSYRST